MRIPEKLLSALTELLSASDEHDAEALDWQCTGFKSNETNLCGWMSNQANEAWYFHPIGNWNRTSKNTVLPTDWEHNSHLTELVRNSIVLPIALRVPKDLSNQLGVISCDGVGSVFFARCANLKLVARTLQTWGKPPESIVRDWQTQLDSRTNATSWPSTSETLITDDGVLIPLTNTLDQIAQIAQSGTSTRSDVDRRLVSNLERVSVPSPAWFVALEICVQVRTPIADALATENRFGIVNRRQLATLPEPAEGDSRTQIRSQPTEAIQGHQQNSRSTSNALAHKRKTKARAFRIGTAVAAIAILGPCIWLFGPVPKPDNRLPNSKPPNSSDSIESDIVEMESPADLSTFLVGNEIQASESALDTILAQLKSNGLDSMSASSIVTEALTQASPNLPTVDTEGIGEESEDSIPSVFPILIRSEEGILTLERPLRIQSASRKETVMIGKPVLAKACHCEVEWKLANKVVIEPTHKVTIEGIGKASWRIAIEDEEPELVVEIASKPGARWQVITTVGLRESPSAIPIFIGPRDAQIVGNRLIDYRQWLIQAVESLRTARANSRARNGIDWTGEIKKLDFQKREAEKSIDRWKVVAKLCHYFFDSNELRLQFNAVEKK